VVPLFCTSFGRATGQPVVFCLQFFPKIEEYSNCISHHYCEKFHAKEASRMVLSTIEKIDRIDLIFIIDSTLKRYSPGMEHSPLASSLFSGLIILSGRLWSKYAG
jgi:hypothetical protein